MARAFWTTIATLACLWLLLQFGILRGPLAFYASYILSVAFSLACPLLLIMLFWAPGLFNELTAAPRSAWSRVAAHRREVEDLKQKIAHLDKAHHMALLGTVYLREGRVRRAQEWFERAREKEPDLLDARYKLALCHFEQKQYAEAAPLLEEVHKEKPGHDYGVAYLRLAESHQRLGDLDRAAEVYEQLLQFYPGQPEACYHYALLEADRGDMEKAKKLMEGVVFSVRHSPAFQRRRNRHWQLKARWWLLRH